MPIPDALQEDWYFHRIASSQRYSSGLVEIERDWSLADVERAHWALDLVES